MKKYTEQDVTDNGCGMLRIACDRSELLDDPPAWLAAGLQETRSGYGARLNTGLKIHFCGRLYRIYCTIYSNCGTCWFKVRGRKIIVS